jgi:DNA-binding protein H-NS
MLRSESFLPYMDKIANAIKNMSFSPTRPPKVGDDVQRMDRTLPSAMKNADRQKTWTGTGAQPDLERVSVSNQSNSRLSHLKDKRIKSFRS